MDNSLIIAAAGQTSFWKSIWENPTNRKYLLRGLGVSVVEFIVFKILYPYPDFFSDSYSYISVASHHLKAGIWPIGYSWFLSLIHGITYNSVFLVAVQYLLMQIASLSFFFTLDYFFEIGPAFRRILLGFIVINPLTLYLCNTINSDALFTALSLVWLTQLIWIIYRPRYTYIYTHAALLLLCFTVRNNAYYYPVISLIVFLSCRSGKLFKWCGIGLFAGSILYFVLWTRDEVYKLTGTQQFSLFTGWQLANNALYIYNEVEVDSADFPTPGSRELNRMTMDWLKKVNPQALSDALDGYVGNFFIKQPDAPLKQYFAKHADRKDTLELGLIREWGRTSEDFAPFGKTVIIHHPLAYVQYFMGRNLSHYFLPPLSHLELYNYGESTIDPIARDWFHFKEARVSCVSYSLQGGLIIYSALFPLINAYFLWYAFLFITKRRFNTASRELNILLGSMAFFVLLNFLFSLSATANILRYQIVPMILMLFTGVLLDQYHGMAQKSANPPPPPASNREEDNSKPLSFQPKIS